MARKMAAGAWKQEQMLQICAPRVWGTAVSLLGSFCHTFGFTSVCAYRAVEDAEAVVEQESGGKQSGVVRKE